MSEFGWGDDRPPERIVDYLWSLRRRGKAEEVEHVIALLDHANPTVREEAVSLLGHWKEPAYREYVLRLVQTDPDPGVRSRSAIAIPRLSVPATRAKDLDELRTIVLDEGEVQEVRLAALQALRLLYGVKPGAFRGNSDISASLDWVRSLE